MVNQCDRVGRLRKLSARVEQLPRSAARDALLREVRSRYVAVETEPRERSTAHSLPNRDLLERLFCG
jgi:hypothetical protein